MNSVNSKTLVIIFSAILLAAFFMPWINFFVSVSAWDIVFGRIGEEIKSPAKYLGVIIPLAGGIILFSAAFREEKYPIDKRILFSSPLIALIIIGFVIGDKLDTGGRIRFSDLDNIRKFFGIGFWLTIVGSIILAILGVRPVVNDQPTSTLGNTEPLHNENPVSLSDPITKEIIRPQININLPKINLSKNISYVTDFIRKYKVIILGSLSVFIVFIIVYNLFIKPDPVKDAKTISSAPCDCTTKYNENMIKVDNDFLNSFDKYQFSKKQDARNKLQELQNAIGIEYTNCNSMAQQQYNETRIKYISNSKNLSIFESTYNSLSGTCNPSNQGELATLYTETENKILTIKDPEPDLAKIKSDLIGQKIMGWNFEQLSEFADAAITNTTKGNDRIEYNMTLHLAGYRDPSNDIHDAEVIVTYIQNINGWYFSDIKEISITSTYVAQVNNWSTINLRDYKAQYTIFDNGQRFWVKDGSWGSTYKGGPGGETLNLRESEIYISSREDHPVTLVFKFTPYN